MSQMIKESDNIQENFNNFSRKTKFLEMNQILSNESQKQMLFLLYYDQDFSNISMTIIILDIIKFSLEENNSFTLEVELLDFETFSFKFDTKLRNIIFPFEHKTNEQNRVFYTDVYSLYSNVFTFHKNRIDTKDFSKIKTFDSPNIFLSQTFMNHFFTISKNATITIFNDNLKSTTLTFTEETFKTVNKGIFFNHTHLIMLHNKSFFGLMDLR